MKIHAPAILVALVACYPTTTRPPFQPMPAAPVTEIELPVERATSALAVLLDQDSIPVRRTEPRDGWLETGWFDAQTLQPTSRRVLGEGVVRIRAWIDPSRPSAGPAQRNHSNLTVETVYRPLADPSRPERELEEQVPASNPVAARVALVLAELARAYGGVDTTAAAKADSTARRADTTGIHRRNKLSGDSMGRAPGADTTTRIPPGDSTARKPVPDSAGHKPPAGPPVKKPVRDSANGKPRPDTASRAPMVPGVRGGNFLP